MKKLIYALTFAVCAAAVAFGAAVQSADIKIPASGKVEVTLSKAAAAKPVKVEFAGLVPDSGTYTLKTVHVMANGTPITNTVQSATSVATNAVVAADYVKRGDKLVIEFSAATNGAVCVTSEIYK